MKTFTTASPFITPGFTPPAIKRLIILTAVVSLFCSLTNGLFYSWFGIPGPTEWLSLSHWGISHYLLWQPLTYLFVYSSGAYGISLFYLLGLAFTLYILWIIGSEIHSRTGTKPFVRFYLTSGVIAGLLALLTSSATSPYASFAGPAPALLALLTVWAMLHPERELLLFFVFPIKVKWLIAGVLGAITLINLSGLNLPYLVFYLGGALTGYLYAVIAWGLKSPFPITHEVDDILSSFGSKVRHRLSGKKSGEKIVDISTGKSAAGDDLFMEEMLTKISQQGSDALSWRQRRRMERISEKKRKKR